MSWEFIGILLPLTYAQKILSGQKKLCINNHALIHATQSIKAWITGDIVSLVIFAICLHLRSLVTSCYWCFLMSLPPLFFSICFSSSPPLEQPLQWTDCRPVNSYQSSEWSTKQSTLFSMEGDDKWQRTLRSTRLA